MADAELRYSLEATNDETAQLYYTALAIQDAVEQWGTPGAGTDTYKVSTALLPANAYVACQHRFDIELVDEYVQWDGGNVQILGTNFTLAASGWLNMPEEGHDPADGYYALGAEKFYEPQGSDEHLSSAKYNFPERWQASSPEPDDTAPAAEHTFYASLQANMAAETGLGLSPADVQKIVRTLAIAGGTAVTRVHRNVDLHSFLELAPIDVVEGVSGTGWLPEISYASTSPIVTPNTPLPGYEEAYSVQLTRPDGTRQTIGLDMAHYTAPDQLDPAQQHTMLVAMLVAGAEEPSTFVGVDVWQKEELDTLATDPRQAGQILRPLRQLAESYMKLGQYFSSDQFAVLRGLGGFDDPAEPAAEYGLRAIKHVLFPDNH